MEKKLRILFILIINFIVCAIGVFVFNPINIYADEIPIFDVTDSEFGAIPDDEGDDYNAINNALKKAREYDEIIEVYVPEGEYIISDQLYIYPNTKLVLDENAVVKSTLLTDMSAMVMGLSDDGESTYGGYTRLENIEISGGTWEREGAPNILTGAFILQHGNNINIHDLTIKNCTDHIINISADKDVTIKNVTFENHIAYTGNSDEFWGSYSVGDIERYMFVEAVHTDNAGDGEKGALPLDNTPCENITVEDCTFNGVLSGVGTHHESEYKAKNVTVKNCEFTNIQYGEAVNAWAFDSLNVTGNTFTGSHSGVIAKESNGTISGNSFNMVGVTCNYGVIHLENSDFTVQDNIIENANKYSIMILNGKAIVSENTLNNSNSDGVRVDNATQITINNNTISNITRYGMFLYNCNGNNDVNNNVISSASNGGSTGIFMEKSSNINVKENTVSGLFNNTICFQESSGTIDNNLLNASRKNSIYLNNSNTTVTSNKIYNSSSNAIYALNGKAIINGNTIDGVSNNDGIRADKNSEINISNNKINNVARYGMFISNSTTGAIISSNEVNGSEEFVGIFVQNCGNNNLIEKNNVRCGTLAGIWADKCSGTISENMVVGCSGDAIQTNGDSDNIATFTINNNTLKSPSSKYDIRLNVYSRNCIVKDNIFEGGGLTSANGVTYTLTELTGVGKDSSGILRYYRNGIKDNNANGLFSSGGIWYYVQNGIVDTSATKLVQHNGNWYYIQNGILTWGVRTLVLHEGTWYYVTNSTLDWNYTGIFRYNGTDYYIQGGVLKWGVNGPTKVGDNWYYLVNSVVQKCSYPDVSSSDWFKNAVEYVYNRGLMSGYSSGENAGKFGPNDSITRGQIVTILYRREGQPAVSGSLNFVDKDDSSLWSASYYNNAILWASQKGIVTGYKDGENAGKFLPDKEITREEFAIILQRYAKLKGAATNDSSELTGFYDYELVSPGAKSGLEWAVAKGIISGDIATTPPSLKPQGNATRAEAATMIMRFCENIK